MRDGHGRKICYLRLSVTDRCNCRCLYCMPKDGISLRSHDDILSFKGLCRIVKAAVSLGVYKVRLTGGELLVRKDIVTLVQMIAQIPGLKELSMTTNATLLAPVAHDLHAAGLARLNISLDTLDATRYAHITGRDMLSHALAGIKAAKDASFTRTKINCVLPGGINSEEIRSLVHLANDQEVSLRFIELMPLGVCVSWPCTRFVSADVVLAALPELERVRRDGVAELYRISGWRGTVSLIRPMTRRFCDKFDRIRVTADGMLKPCLHPATEIALRGLSHASLRNALHAGIMCKPKNHIMDEKRSSEATRAMNEIGG